MSDQNVVPNPPFPVDRKIWVPQIAMVLTFITATLTSRLWGVDLPNEVQLAIMGLMVTVIGGAVGWLTPAARSDITSKLDNSLIAEAQADPESPVDLAKIVDDRTIARAQLDPDNTGATIPAGETVKTLTAKLAYSP